MIDFEPFRGRSEPGLGEQVDVYRRIIGGNVDGPVVWSVRNMRGLVVGHCREITLSRPLAFVNGMAQQRIAAGGPREVHAFIRGMVATDYGTRRETVSLAPVTYDPRLHPYFLYRSDDAVFNGGLLAHFNEKGMHA